jgi:cytochrome oxidase Cu insertion factor (SCO1/SenC/PrrC family)
MNKTTIFAVLAVFFAPVILAILLNSRWLDWRPGETRNHGELIEPAVRLPAFELETADDTSTSREDLAGFWQLLHYRPGPCDEACLDALYWMRQVRRAQDRHRPEIELVFVTPAELPPDTRAAIRDLSEHFRIFSGTSGSELSDAFPDDGLSAVSYIVDPEGHIILRYPQDADFNGMRRDLGRLLTWTQTGPE